MCHINVILAFITFTTKAAKNLELYNVFFCCFILLALLLFWMTQITPNDNNNILFIVH